jgi:hypothetical protein
LPKEIEMAEERTREPQSPFDKEPAEGSRETIDKQLQQQERKDPKGTADPVTAPTGQTS